MNYDYDSLPESKKRLIKQSYEDGQHLYFIKTGNMVKVGKAKTPEGRLYVMQTGTPRKLELLLVVPYCGGLLETYVHEQLTKQGAHFRGEWFKYNNATKDAAKRFKEILKELGIKYDKKTQKVLGMA